MIFGRTKDTICALEALDHLTIDNILGILSDLQEDAESRGTPVATLPIDNLPDTVKYLRKSMQLLLGIAGMHKDEINSSDFLGMAEKARSSLSQQEAALSDMLQPLEAAEKESALKLAVLQKEKQQLQFRQTALQNKIAQSEGLKKECADLKDIVDRLEGIDLSTLNRERDTLLQQKAAAEAAAGKVRSETDALRRQILSAGQEKQGLDDDLTAKKAELSSIREKVVQINLDIEQCHSDILSKNSQFAKLNEELNSLKIRQNGLDSSIVEKQNSILVLNELLSEDGQKSLWKQKAELDSQLRELKRAQNKLDTEIAELDSNIEDLNQLVKPKEHRRDSRLETQSRLQHMALSLDAEVKDLDGKISDLSQKINSLRSYKAAHEHEPESLQFEKNALDAEVNQLNIKRNLAQEKYENAKAERDDSKKKLDTLKDLFNTTQVDIAALKKSISQKTLELQNAEDELARLKTEKEAKESLFSGLTYTKKQEEIEQTRMKVKQFSNALTLLNMEDLSRFGVSVEEQRTELQKRISSLLEEITDINHKLSRCAKTYISICNAIGGNQS